MTTTLLRAGALACALLTTTCLTAPALAQTPPPRFSQVDDNGVDLVTGEYVWSLTEGSIGAGEGAVALTRFVSASSLRTQWTGLLYRRTVGSTPLMFVEFGSIADTFTISGSTYSATKADGATLVALGGGQYRYTAADGTRILYDGQFEEEGSIQPYPVSNSQCDVAEPGTCAIPIRMTRPNGMIFTIAWDMAFHCGGRDAQLDCIDPKAYVRFDGVTSSANYSFSTSYQTDNPGNFSAPVPAWYQRSGVTFTNLASAPSPLPTIGYAYPSAGVEEMTDTGGRTWRFASSGADFSIRRPGSTADDIVVTYSGGVVTQAVRDGITTTYSRSTSGTTLTTTIAAGGNVTIVAANLANGRITQVTDPLSRVTSYQYDGNGRLTRVTRPEGDYVEYTYDARGNVTQALMRDKAGNSANDIVASAAFDAACSNAVTCNRPNSVTDARGNITDYGWSATHGGLLSVTAPAPTTGATRPQTRYGYSQVTAVTGQPVYLPTNVSQCRTTSACDGQADETETDIAYGSANLLPASIASGGGDGALTATTAATYDAIGNLLTLDGPLAGTADTIRYRYNAARELTGVIGPDPDGGGALEHRARRFVRDGGGRVTDVETGTVDSQSDADWAAMTVLEEVEQDYDGNHRPSVRRLRSGATIHALTQTGYDNLGRVQCVAQRMNPSAFGSLPSDACTLDSEGSHGPDRIARTSYDAAGQVTLVQTGYGVTGVAADEVAATYSNNGQLATVTDAEGNRTTYEYDGFDRLVKTRFPSPTTDNASSTTDYEQLTLDPAGNVTARRLRDGQTIAFAYDNLNRLITRDGPNAAWLETDQSLAYDNLGRLVTAGDSNGHTLGFVYDALGRLTTENDNWYGAAAGYGYDSAGRRIWLSWRDGAYVAYDHLVTGEISAIRENGATSGAGVLATYSYDDRGRRTSLTRGNGTVTSYSYDDVSRLTGLTQDLAGTANDLTLGFSLNPASQIVQSTRSNDAYGFVEANTNFGNTINGLNQMTMTGSVAIGHDARGNVSAVGASSYGYTADNQLAAAPGSSYAYDPAGRLFHESTPGSVLRYDGDSLIMETDAATNAIRRRYVFGPGIDEPLVWYEGSGLADRRWFHADERGSIVAVSDGGGAATAVNRYNEYGIYQGTLTGRFGYTGQAWLPELGMFYYRARIYNPGLGRFMQTDPIGYGGGMNLYAYVRNDPVNFTDASGLGPNDPPCTDCTGPDPVVTARSIAGFGFGFGSTGGLQPRMVSENSDGAGGSQQQRRPPQPPRSALRPPTPREQACAAATGAVVAGAALGAVAGAAGILALVPAPSTPVLGTFAVVSGGVAAILAGVGTVVQLAACD